MNHFGNITIKRFSLQEVGQFLLMCLLFLAAMNFDGKFFYWIFGSFFVWAVTCHSRIRVDVSLLMLVLLALNIIIFAPGMATGGISNLLRPVGYVLCYILGRGIFDLYNTEREQIQIRGIIVKVFWILVYGLVVHVLLNFALNFGSLSRNIVDVWTRQNLNATGQAALSCLPVAVASAFLFINGERKYKMLSVAILIFVVINNLVLAGRTLIIYIALCLSIGLIYFWFCSQAARNTKRNVLIVFFAMVILCIVVYQNNVLGVQTMFLESNLYYRLTETLSGLFLDNSRSDVKIIYLNNLESSFWGGNHIRYSIGRYAHDLYLDTYDYAGIFAFISVCVYSMCSIVRMVRCVFNKRFDWQLRQIILSVYLVFHIEFLIEPIMLGLPWFFALFCLIDGMVGSYLKLGV